MSDTGTESRPMPLWQERRRLQPQVQITRPCQDCVTYRMKVDGLQRNIASGNAASEKQAGALKYANQMHVVWRGVAMAAGNYISNGDDESQAQFWGLLRAAAGMEEKDKSDG